MDEDIAIINSKTKNEKIKNFIIENKKSLVFTLVLIISILFSFYFYQLYKKNHNEQLSDRYNKAIIDYNNGDKSKVINEMREIVYDKDSTYSPLALYFLVDNKLTENREEINELFDVVINKTSLDDEIKNLIVYKKALFNADSILENELLDILNPLINSESIWKSHALYLIAEYFYSKDEKQKSKEFFSQILSLENANRDLAIKAQKRLNRDLGD